jgi:membrane protein
LSRFRFDRPNGCVERAGGARFESPMDKQTTAKSDVGRQASSPWRIPAAGWKQIILRTWNQAWADNVGLVAAGVAFYGFLALLPLLGLIVLIFGFVADAQTVIDSMGALTAVLPTEIAGAIGEQLMTAVQTSEGTKGLGILIALLFAFYGGSNGAGAAITALNIAYQEKEKRSLLTVYAIALAMTLAAVLLALLALAATAVLAELEALAPDASGAAVILGKAASYLGLVLVAAAVAATLYRFGPSREDARWQWITPGSLFTAVTWLLLTVLFGFYLTRVTDYDATYGQLGAIVALQTWMYLSAYVFVFGAELNSEIEHQTAKDSTTGEPQPLGTRGAWSADHVAGGKEEATTEDAPSLADAAPGAKEQREKEAR